MREMLTELRPGRRSEKKDLQLQRDQRETEIGAEY